MLGRLKSFLIGRFWARAFSEGGITTWLAEPAVRRFVNERVTGSPERWPLEALAAETAEPFGRALSLGCGEGALERDLRRKGLCREILGLDLSEGALELARAKAVEEGLGGLEYRRADLDRLGPDGLDTDGPFDAVFFHQAAHHVRDLEGCFAAVARSLVPGGLFYLDEYVGPSRGDWSRALLARAQALFDTIPRSLRRRRRLQLPVDWRDPSEAVRSAEILPVLEERFTILDRRDYGGNLLSVIYPHLALEGASPEEREAVLGRLLDAERELLDAGEPGFYTVLRATPHPRP